MKIKVRAKNLWLLENLDSSLGYCMVNWFGCTTILVSAKDNGVQSAFELHTWMFNFKLEFIVRWKEIKDVHV